MGSVAPDVAYKITLDATLILGVVIYHVLLFAVHSMLRRGKGTGISPEESPPDPIDPPSAPTYADVVTCKATPVYFTPKRGECFHTTLKCEKLGSAKSVQQLRPCPTCSSICYMHTKK